MVIDEVHGGSQACEGPKKARKKETRKTGRQGPWGEAVTALSSRKGDREMAWGN